MSDRLQEIDPETYDRLARCAPPSDDDAEQMLLGGMLRFPERFVDLMDLVTPDQFYTPQHGAIWEAMLYLHEDGTPIDVVTVHDRIKTMNPFRNAPDWRLKILELHNESVTAANATVWAAKITKTYRVRKLLAELGCLIGRAAEPGVDPDELLEEMSGIEEKLESNRPSVAKTVGDVALHVLKDLDESRKLKRPTGTPTRFIDFDRAVGGARPGELIIVAARPGMGKTAFAGNVSTNIAEGRPVLFCSIEMPEDDIVQRMLSSLSGVNSIRIRDAMTCDDEMARLQGARATLGRSKLWIADVPNATIGQIAGLARRVKHKCGDLAVVVVDYLQLINHHGNNVPREQQLSEISRKLKGLARQLNCTVIALSQLNRECEKRADKRPLLSDLRESGAIEQDADIVAFLYREELNSPGDARVKGQAELIIGKARKGGVGVVSLTYDGPTTTFRNAAPNWQNGSPGGGMTHDSL